MMRLTKIAATVLSLALVAGCASFPERYEKGLSPMGAVKETSDSWAEQPSVQYVKTRTGIAARRYMELPPDLAGAKLDYEFRKGVTLTQLVDTLNDRMKGLRVVVSPNLPEALQLRNYKGTLKGMLELLEVAHDINYEYRKGVLFLVPAARYVVTLPQHQGLIDAVVKTLTSLKAAEVRTDIASGEVYYEATPSVEEQIQQYLDSIAKNSAMVTLQVAVLDVRLNRDIGVGMDWSQFNVSRGTDGLQGHAENGGALPTTTSNTANGSTNNTATVAALGELLTFAGSSGMTFKLVKEGFSLAAAIKALSRFGEARTDQNAILSTMSGAPVKISSGTSIPYVKNIGATTTSNSNAVTGSTTTDTVKSGLKLSITPRFDAQDNLVMTEVSVEMATLVGFRELSAGTNLGTLSQPEIQEMTFENIGRLRPGETMIVGGLTYDQVTTNYTSLPGLEKQKAGSENKTIRKNALYIVLRPTIVLFGDKPPAQYQALLNAAVDAAPIRQDQVPAVKAAPLVTEPVAQQPGANPTNKAAALDALARAKKLLKTAK